MKDKNFENFMGFWGKCCLFPGVIRKHKLSGTSKAKYIFRVRAYSPATRDKTHHRTAASSQLASVWDSAWFLVSSWARGSTYRPLAHSTRLLTSCWWIFSLAIIITFFSLLPSQLARLPVTRTRHQSVASVLEEVENIGVVEGGSTHQLLKVT